MIYKEFDLSLPLIKELKFSKQTPRMREDFYDYASVNRFPSKNHPEVTAYMIKKYCPPHGIVFDPMAGIGTTLVESIKLDRVAIGNELYKANVEKIKTNLKVAYKRSDSLVESYIYNGDARNCAKLDHLWNLVLFSPPYGKQNHSAGKNSKQKALLEEKRLWSCQEYNDPNDLSDDDLSRSLNMKRFYKAMDEIIAGCFVNHTLYGHIAIILQDYIRKGKPVGLVKNICDILSKYYTPIGYYLRELPITMFKQMQLAKNNSVVGVEHTLIYQKTRPYHDLSQ